MSIVNVIKRLLPIHIVRKLHFFKLNLCQSRLYREIYIRRIVKKIRNKEVIRVLFIAISPAIWKVDSLYKSLSSHNRFKVDILASTNLSIKDTQLRNCEIQNLKIFFDEKGYPYREVDDSSLSMDLYDILIYPQPYSGLVPQSYDFIKYLHKLLICCEYSFHSVVQNWAYNKVYQNVAWLDCYENDEVRNFSCKQKEIKELTHYQQVFPLWMSLPKKSFRLHGNCRGGLVKKLFGHHIGLLQKMALI